MLTDKKNKMCSCYILGRTEETKAFRKHSFADVIISTGHFATTILYVWKRDLLMKKGEWSVLLPLQMVSMILNDIETEGTGCDRWAALPTQLVIQLTTQLTLVLPTLKVESYHTQITTHAIRSNVSAIKGNASINRKLWIEICTDNARLGFTLLSRYRLIHGRYCVYRWGREG